MVLFLQLSLSSCVVRKACTECVIVNEVCQAIMKVLLKRYVKFPAASNAIKDIVNEFETKCGFSQCIGPILAPQECAKDYYNRKGFHSVIMQAVADHCYLST